MCVRAHVCGSSSLKRVCHRLPLSSPVQCYGATSFIFLLLGTPMPTVTWFKNGQPLYGGGNVQLIQSPENCCIRVVGASRADSGEYELVLSNESGTERVPITFHVEGQSSLV